VIDIVTHIPAALTQVLEENRCSAGRQRG
jgi:hypothetical protein